MKLFEQVIKFKSVSPGSMLSPYYIRQKPDEARALFVPKPAGFLESPSRLDNHNKYNSYPLTKGLIANFKVPT